MGGIKKCIDSVEGWKMKDWFKIRFEIDRGHWQHYKTGMIVASSFLAGVLAFYSLSHFIEMMVLSAPARYIGHMIDLSALMAVKGFMYGAVCMLVLWIVADVIKIIIKGKNRRKKAPRR